jgi:hypothetical protein
VKANSKLSFVLVGIKIQCQAQLFSSLCGYGSQIPLEVLKQQNEYRREFEMFSRNEDCGLTKAYCWNVQN